MRLRNKPGAAEKLAQYSQYVVTEPINWKEKFDNAHPIHVEIGTGKGQFITEMAKMHPDINYIGIELQTNVIVVALDKLIAEDLPNLQLLHVNGADLSEYFEAGEVDRIYLNFSDPWPKKKHEKRRLTYSSFLQTYHEIIADNGEIHFKTDNQGLFEYSLASFSKYGLTLKQVWLDLHSSNFEGNIMTEYEEKFSAKGNPIYRVEVSFTLKK